MKTRKIILVTITAILTIFFINGCTKDNNAFRLDNISHSDCKNTKKSVAVNQSSDEKEVIEIKADQQYLNINHVNVYFTCEPGKLTADAVLNDTVVTISEAEQKHDVDCICPFDLNYRIGPLAYGKYYFVFMRGAMEYTHFTVDFHAKLDTVIEINPN
jgi:hypothetical protein